MKNTNTHQEILKSGCYYTLKETRENPVRFWTVLEGGNQARALSYPGTDEASEIGTQKHQEGIPLLNAWKLSYALY